jgi:hypothetical protein
LPSVERTPRPAHGGILHHNSHEADPQAFVEASADPFFVPPYVGTDGWIGVRLDSGLDGP